MKLILPLVAYSLPSFMIVLVLLALSLLNFSTQSEQKSFSPHLQFYCSTHLACWSTYLALKKTRMWDTVIRICSCFACCGTSVPHCFLWKLRKLPVHHDVKWEKFWNPLREPEKSAQIYYTTSIKAKLVFWGKAPTNHAHFGSFNFTRSKSFCCMYFKWKKSSVSDYHLWSESFKEVTELGFLTETQMQIWGRISVCLFQACIYTMNIISNKRQRNYHHTLFQISCQKHAGPRH